MAIKYFGRFHPDGQDPFDFQFVQDGDTVHRTDIHRLGGAVLPKEAVDTILDELFVAVQNYKNKISAASKIEVYAKVEED